MRSPSAVVLMLAGCFSSIAGAAALLYSQAILHTSSCSNHCGELFAMVGLGDYVLLSYLGVILIVFGVGLFSLFGVVFAVQRHRTKAAK